MDVDAFTFFASVVKAGSFTNAAARLGIDRSNVSRRIRNLEQELGTQLLRRTTRRMELTETGALFYERCAVIEAEVQNAHKALHSLRTSVRGPVSMSCPPMLGRHFLAPILARFCMMHPDVHLQVLLKTHVVDLIGEGIDVALRLIDTPVPNTVVRELADVKWIICASPGYLRKHEAPQVPEDLAHHTWVGQRSRLSLEMVCGTQHRRVSVTSRLECADLTFVREAVIGGLGIGLMPAYIARDALRRKKLRTVLDEFHLSPSPGNKLYAITLATRYTPPQVLALLDFLDASFRPHPPWEEADRQAHPAELGGSAKGGKASQRRATAPARRR